MAIMIEVLIDDRLVHAMLNMLPPTHEHWIHSLVVGGNLPSFDKLVGKLMCKKKCRNNWANHLDEKTLNWFMEWRRILLTLNQNMRNKKYINQKIKSCSLAFVLFTKRKVLLYTKLPIQKYETRRKR
jgi:hypothetical protein